MQLLRRRSAKADTDDGPAFHGMEAVEQMPAWDDGAGADAPEYAQHDPAPSWDGGAGWEAAPSPMSAEEAELFRLVMETPPVSDETLALLGAPVSQGAPQVAPPADRRSRSDESPRMRRAMARPEAARRRCNGIIAKTVDGRENARCDLRRQHEGYCRTL